MKLANTEIYTQTYRWKFPLDRGRFQADPQGVLETRCGFPKRNPSQRRVEKLSGGKGGLLRKGES